MALQEATVGFTPTMALVIIAVVSEYTSGKSGNWYINGSIVAVKSHP